ncbi:Hypothetical predicted protein [Podarcis lilfordi]|uniref:Uncharacterized protein n=1 Tax=Podarcis lilfordi TaxID=74358 RepID=A0AA35JYF4_9SAUR|nr:Hypothetical predicted protein [Podarcis lilfordi]
MTLLKRVLEACTPPHKSHLKFFILWGWFIHFILAVILRGNLGCCVMRPFHLLFFLLPHPFLEQEEFLYSFLHRVPGKQLPLMQGGWGQHTHSFTAERITA